MAADWSELGRLFDAHQRESRLALAVAALTGVDHLLAGVIDSGDDLLRNVRGAALRAAELRRQALQAVRKLPPIPPPGTVRGCTPTRPAGSPPGASAPPELGEGGALGSSGGGRP